MNVPTFLPPSNAGFQAAPLVGQSIGGRYRILRPVGRGGMGVVYLAEELGSGTEVVVKLMRGHLFSDPQATARFAREAKRLAALRHPNIVEMLDYGHEEGMAYLVMSYVEGRPLTSLIHERGHLSLAQFIPIAAQILKGVGYAHTHEVMIRDIKSSNIMLCERKGRENYVMLLDFGLAKALREEVPITQEHVLGTAGYIAPEALTQDACGLAVDVYALGVLFWTMLCGRPPYQADNDASIFYKTIHSPVPELKDALPPGSEVPTALATLIEQSLAKHPDQRPADANEMVELLIDCTPARLFRLPKLSGPRRPRHPGEGNSGLIALTGVNPSGQYPKMVTNNGPERASAQPGTPHFKTPAFGVPCAPSSDQGRNPVSQRPFLISTPISSTVKPQPERTRAMPEPDPETIVTDEVPSQVPLPPLLDARAHGSGTAPRVEGVPLVPAEHAQDFVADGLPAAPADTEDDGGTMIQGATSPEFKRSRMGAVIGIAAALALVVGGLGLFAEGTSPPDSTGARPAAQDLSTSAVVSSPLSEPSGAAAEAMDVRPPISAAPSVPPDPGADAPTQSAEDFEPTPQGVTVDAAPAPAADLPTRSRRVRRSAAASPAGAAVTAEAASPGPAPDEPAPQGPDAAPEPEVAEVVEPSVAPARPTTAPILKPSRPKPSDAGLLAPVSDRRGSAGALMKPTDGPR